LFFYEGKGYSEAFVKNMDKVAETLNKDSSIQIFLEEGCDDLCGACPHHTIKDGCRSNQKVKSLDQKVLETFNLKANKQYFYQDLTDKIHREFSQATFEKICSDCEWYKIGVCGRGLIKDK
jgi:hypothetical protein